MKETIVKLYGVMESIKMLYLMKVINQNVYEHLLSNLQDALDKVSLQVESDNEDLAEVNSFSEGEKFVNNHINLADSLVLLDEVKRRGISNEHEKE